MKNPFEQPPRPVQITVTAMPDSLDIIELRMEEVALTITRYVDPVTPHLTLIVDSAGIEEVQAIIASVDATATLQVMKLADIDWVSQVQKDFPPFALGRFYVYGSHAKNTVPKNHHPLLIDAVAAFGTGEHSTTAGCLLALEEVKKKWKNAPSPQTREHVPPPVRGRLGGGRHLRAGHETITATPQPSSSGGGSMSILDVGCGTVILGIGAARLWKNARIEACDNDPIAVDVSRINLKANRIANRSKAWVSNGYKHQPIRKLPEQPVIVANILAKPLMKMAKDAAQKLAPGGTLILSGLLNEQENMVLAAHRAQGLYLHKRMRRGKWSILTLRR